MQQPPDPRRTPGAPERKFRSRKRAEAAAPPEPVSPPPVWQPPVPQPPPQRPVAQQAMQTPSPRPAPPPRQQPPASPQRTPAPPPAPSAPAQRQARFAEAPPQEPARRGKRALSEPLKWALVLVPMMIVLIAAGMIGRQMYRDYLYREAERKRIAAEEAELAAHPLKYREYIERYAAEYGLDPSLVAAVVLCESSFDSTAISRVEARGLMQLMPETAEWIAGKFDDIDGYTFDMMFDPETNIRFGCWYLGYLSGRFGGDPLKMICAYHAGQGNVDAWLQNPLYSPDGVTLRTIATADTAQYAERVLRAQQVYQRRYYASAAQHTGTTAKEEAYASI